MSKQQHPNQRLIQFILRAQSIALKDDRPAQGYAMMIVSIVSILMFSMLAACLTITNLSKLSTDASIDGNNSFYVAESGLNKRASALREIFDNYLTPSGLSPGQATANSPVTLANISNCFSKPITTATSVVSSDFECRNYPFRYNNNAAQARDSNGNIVLGEQDNNRNSSNYIAHTFVADRTKYKDGNPLLGPEPVKIPSGQAYAGINAQEHTYTVYSTAKKPNAVNSNAAASFTSAEIDAKNRATKMAGDDALIASYDNKTASAAATNAGRAANNSTIDTVLQMDFKVRAIPLFQFGAFYNNDLEISPFSRMDFYGRIHTNKTLTINSNDTAGLYFAGANAGTTGDHLNYAITAVNDIYTKDLANNGGNGFNYIVMPGGSQSITLSDGRVVMANKLANDKDTPLNNSATAPADYKLDNFSPYLLNYLSSTPIEELTLPPLGFLRKTDSTGAIGDYYGKADLRLTMRFDRAIPFDLTTIKIGTSTSSTCPTSLNIPADRAGKSTAECSTLSKGKLKSLMQPVLVLAKDNANERARFCTQSIPVRQTDSTIAPSDLNSINNVTVNATLDGLSSQNQDKILRALQVAIAAASNRVGYENVTKTGVLPATEQATFKSLLERLKTASSSDSALKSALNTTTKIEAIAVSPPATIAAIRSGCFLPAPIQKLDTAGSNPYDLREDRAMSLLQANIESMTVWNRDGVYVNFDADLTIPGTATTADINTAFDDVITTTPTTYSTNNLLFTRAEIAASTTSSYQKLGYGSLPDRSFQKLGLGAVDRTEGGLVLHATLDDTDFPIDSADNKRKYGTSSANNYLKSQSRFGLIVSGGSNLPGPLTIASDQAIYTQGDYNTFGFVNITNVGAKQPAAILADMITVLSNSCMSGGIGTPISGGGSQTDNFPRGQVNCLFNDTRAAISSSTNQSRKATPTTVYAAFANNNEASCGNLGSHVDAAYCTDRNARSNVATTFRSASSQYFGGGFHNYIRMVEQWKTATNVKVPFTYRGSMVNLGLPQEFNGLAVWEKVYDMPNRDFGFDPLFNSFDKLPPLTPRVVYIKQDVFKRTY
jgi:hypothetical protein